MTLLASPSRPDQPDRDTLMARSAKLVGLFEQHYRGLVSFISPPRAREHGKRLARLRPDVWTGTGGQAALIMELAVWTADKGRSTALDRYARQATLPAGSDEAAVLVGMRKSVISFWAVGERHPAAGWMLRDLANEGTLWVVDERLDQYLATGGGRCLLTRMFRIEGDAFWVTCGITVPTPEGLAEVGAGQEGGEVRSGSERHAELSRESPYVTVLYAGVLSIAGT